MKNKKREIIDYDHNDTSFMIDPKKGLRLEDIGIKIPPGPTTQVISIRLPTALLNELKALGSQDDVPYQSLIKIFLAEAVKKKKKSA